MPIDIVPNEPVIRNKAQSEACGKLPKLKEPMAEGKKELEELFQVNMNQQKLSGRRGGLFG